MVIAATLARKIATDPVERLRMMMVLGSAALLIFAGEALPLL